MQRIRKGDEVIVITGRDKGKRGTVLSRPNPMTGSTGGIVNKVMPIDQSNVMLVNPATGKGERVGFKEVDGKKVRVFKSDGSIVGAKA